jgi:hypothetical protein
MLVGKRPRAHSRGAPPVSGSCRRRADEGDQRAGGKAIFTTPSITWSLRCGGPGRVEFSQMYPSSAVNIGESRRMSPPYSRFRSYPRAGPRSVRSKVTIVSLYVARVQGPPSARCALASSLMRWELSAHGSSQRCSRRMRADVVHLRLDGRTSESCCQTRCSCRVTGPRERGTHACPIHAVARGAIRRPMAVRTRVRASSDALSNIRGCNSRCVRQFSDSGPMARPCTHT